MSAKLHYRPLNKYIRIDGIELKNILEKRYKLPHKFSYDLDYNYLLGLADAGVEGANYLIEAVQKHGCIEVFLEN